MPELEERIAHMKEIARGLDKAIAGLTEARDAAVGYRPDSSARFLHVDGSKMTAYLSNALSDARNAHQEVKKEHDALVDQRNEGA